MTFRLSEVLVEKACLLVLDDVWKAEAGRAFAALGPRGRMLLTTRDATLLTALGAEEASLEVMQPQAALALLAEWCGQPRASLPKEAERLAKAWGHLPLALALAGAQVRDGRAWADLLHALRDGKLEFLDHPYGSVFGSMRMSVNALPANTARRYHELAVFPEDVPIPEATVVRLWVHTGGLKVYQTRALLVELQRKNLLQLYEGALGFHDLQQDYLRIAVDDLPALHSALLTAYEKELPAGPAPDRWACLPKNEPYLWRSLAYHLGEAGRHEELRALRLSFPWLQAKLRATDLNALIADYGGCPRDDAPGCVRDALRLSAHVLERDPGQLASQLWGRLGNSEEAGIQELLGAAVRGESGPLVPAAAGDAHSARGLLAAHA